MTLLLLLLSDTTNTRASMVPILMLVPLVEARQQKSSPS
jgi:hypothetical protein